MLTNGSLQGVTILKDKILEDNTGVACHPDKENASIGLVAFACVFLCTNICVTCAENCLMCFAF